MNVEQLRLNPAQKNPEKISMTAKMCQSFVKIQARGIKGIINELKVNIFLEPYLSIRPHHHLIEAKELIAAVTVIIVNIK